MDSMNVRKQATADLVGRMPPFNMEAEQAVLASMMHYEDMRDSIAASLRPADFHVPRHAVIYEASLGLLRDGSPVEPRSLAERLAGMKRLEEAGGAEYLNEIWNQEVLGANGLFYAKMVVSKSLQRRLINTCATAMSEVYDTPWDQARPMLDGVLHRIAELAASGETGGRTALIGDSGARAGIRARLKNLAARAENGAISTGLLSLDRLMDGGVRPSELWIIAARPGGCKSALALNISLATALRGLRVLYISLEMSLELLENRLMAICADLPLPLFRQPARMDAACWAALDSADALLDGIPLVLEEHPARRFSVADLHSRCIRIRRELGGLDMVVVDYLQLVRGERAATRELEVGGISQGLKALATELGVPVIALSQLNRAIDQREDRRPVLSDLRESGSIEADADGVLFIHRLATPKQLGASPLETVELIVGKNRSGDQGSVRVFFERQKISFSNADPEGFAPPAPAGVREPCPF